MPMIVPSLVCVPMGSFKFNMLRADALIITVSPHLSDACALEKLRPCSSFMWYKGMYASSTRMSSMGILDEGLSFTLISYTVLLPFKGKTIPRETASICGYFKASFSNTLESQFRLFSTNTFSESKPFPESIIKSSCT